MLILRTLSLFVFTALAEIVGCYAMWVWLRRDGSPLWLALSAAGLGVFGYLLTLHPEAAGRVYAAYGGVYVATAVAWLWVIDGQRPDRFDLIGAALCIAGMSIIFFGRRIF